MPSTIEDRKNNRGNIIKVICLKEKPTDKFSFEVGLWRARLILDNLSAIQQFVVNYNALKGDKNVKP